MVEFAIAFFLTGAVVGAAAFYCYEDYFIGHCQCDLEEDSDGSE